MAEWTYLGLIRDPTFKPHLWNCKYSKLHNTDSVFALFEDSKLLEINAIIRLIRDLPEEA